MLLPVAAAAVTLALPWPALWAALQGSAGARLLDRTGRPIASLPGPDGSLMVRLPSTEVTPACREIFIRMEDRRFLTHPGVDPLALGRAIVERLAAAGSSGASTITMQLARLVSPHPRTPGGKLAEMVEAVRIEVRLPKDRILLEWLNRLPFGRGAVGVGAAARTYFDADLPALSAAQLAVLAVIPRNPSRFDPFDHPQRALAEAERAVRTAGLPIGTEELAAAVQSARRGSLLGLAPHFARYVASLGGRAPVDGQLKTTLDLELNAYVQARINHYLEQARSARVANAAVVAVENATGNVVAWVGSQDFSDEEGSGQVDGVLIRRQSASTLKPFLYGLALEQGWTPASLLPDLELAFAASAEVPGWTGGTQGDLPEASPDLYQPTDFDRRTRGVVRLRTALASSLNIPAVSMLSQVGEQQFLSRLELLGFGVPADAAERWGPGMAIGNAEVTLLELTRAFTIFPRGGSLPSLRVLTPTGAGAQEGAQAGARVCDQRVAWLVVDVLSDPAARAAGFGTRTWFGLPFPAMFKSGTSSEFTDLWCVGATPRWTVGAWAGNFDGRAVINKTGSSLPARIVADVLVHLAGQSPAAAGGQFARPAGIVEAPVCTVSGGAATPACPATRQEFFLSPGDVPAPCAYHTAGGTREDLLYASLVPAGRSARIVLPVDGSTFWIDGRLSPGVQQVPVMVAVLPGGADGISLSLDGRHLRQLAGSVTLGLTAERGQHLLEISGPEVRESSRFTVR